MTLEGVKLSTCVSVFQPTPTCTESVEVLIAILPHFEEAIVRKACRLGNVSFDDTLKKFLDYLLESSHYDAFQPLSEEFYNIYCILAGREQRASSQIDTKNHTTENRVPERTTGEPEPSNSGDQKDSNLEILDMLNTITVNEGGSSPEAESASLMGASSQHAKEILGKNELGESDNTEDASSTVRADKMALISLLRSTLAQVSHFVTTDGTIGMLMRGDKIPEDGDTVCVFKGSVHASLVRPCEGVYAFMGGVRLCNQIGETEYSEDFFSQHQIEHITLV
jgi:hypothetical protein